MTFLEPIKTFINKTDSKTFSYYMIGYIAGCTLFFALIIFYYFSSMKVLDKKIRNINESREKVKDVLGKAALVQQERAVVEETLAKDPDFKIAQELGKIVASPSLNLKDKKDPEETWETSDLEENYRKTVFTVKFHEITMQDLTQLLQKIEENPRIATERLEITKSKKQPKTIDITLAISTLLPKIEITSI